MGFGHLAGPVCVVAAIGLAVVACWVMQSFLIAHSLSAILRGVDPGDLTGPLAGLLGVVAARAALIWLREVAAQWAGVVVKERLRRRLFGALLDLGPAYTSARRTGAIQSTLVDGVEGLQGYYAYYLPQVVVVFAGSGTVLVFLALVDPLVAAVLAMFVVLMPLAPQLWRRSFGRRSQSHWTTYSEVESDYVDAIQGMTTLKSLAAVDHFREHIERRTWNLYRQTIRQQAVSLIGTSLTTLLVWVGSAVAITVAVADFTAGRLTATQLFVVLLLAGECFRPLADLAGYWHLSYVGFSAADDIAALLAAPDTLARRAGDPATATERPVTVLRGHPAVETHDVTFTYPDQDRPAIAKLNLRIEAGEMVAVVGASGAGKTTLLSLLLGFVVAQHGSIRVAGRELSELPADELRSLVGLVPQDPYLFHGTIEDNIRMGDDAATAEQVRAAANVASIARFIESTPAGYRTHVGERGLTLSSGQRQRLAIARAVLRPAPILLLDEPTSSLDGENEGAVTEALAGLAGARTLVVVAHRLSTVQLADRVLVLNDGEIVESGRPGDLLTARGAYYRMVHLEQGGAA